MSNIKLRVVLYSPSEIKYFLNQVGCVQNQIDKLQKGDTFVDVGANIGYFSLLASKRVSDKGRVFAIEPSQREFIKLLTNIELNKARNVIPVNSAAGRESGLVRLKVKKYHTGGNSIETQEDEIAETIWVPQTSLDQLIDKCGIDRIDLLKIDVEGFEFDVLQGLERALGKGKIEKIVVEITPKFLRRFNHDAEGIYSLLGHFGFSPEFGLNRSLQYDEVFTFTARSPTPNTPVNVTDP